MDDLQAQFKKQIDEYLQHIQSRVEKLFKQAIQSAIYDYYTPVQGGYHRNDTFLNSVKAHIDLETGIMYVYNDLNEGSNYYSEVDGSPQFQNLANWMEYGHSDGYGIASKGYNQYHQFEGRRYLETARDLIQSEFPDLKIEIIGNENI